MLTEKEATVEHRYSQITEVVFKKPQPYPLIRVLPAWPNTSVADKLRIKEATVEHRCAKISKVEFEKPQPYSPIRVLPALPNTSVADKLRTKEATVEHRYSQITEVVFLEISTLSTYTSADTANSTGRFSSMDFFRISE